MKKNVLGVKVDDISLKQAQELVLAWITGEGRHFIVTPNPEFIVDAQKDDKFKSALNNADLAIPDGVGLKLAGLKNRVAGVDLMEELITKAAKNGFTIGFLGGNTGVAEKLAERLKDQYQNISIKFSDSRIEIDGDGNVAMDNGSRLEKQLPKLDILFVAFGHPKQEKWIAKNLANLPVKVVMGVGGSFDYLSGQVIRAPKFLRQLGLEWLFRLVVQPWRIKRQLKLVKFVYLLVKHKFSVLN